MRTCSCIIIIMPLALDYFKIVVYRENFFIVQKNLSWRQAGGELYFSHDGIRTTCLALDDDGSRLPSLVLRLKLPTADLWHQAPETLLNLKKKMKQKEVCKNRLISASNHLRSMGKVHSPKVDWKLKTIKPSSAPSSLCKLSIASAAPRPRPVSSGRAFWKKADSIRSINTSHNQHLFTCSYVTSLLIQAT